MKPYNVVYLHSHDTGRCVQPYGSMIRTPHMQSFAEEGVVYRQAFCAGPTCSPSRAALLTGRAPHAVGMFGLAHRGWSLSDYSLTLPARLTRSGYQTVLAGIQHIAPWTDCEAEVIGYNHRLYANSGTERADNACAFLNEAKGLDRPFFLDVGFIETHRSANFEKEGGGLIAWHNNSQTPQGDPRYVSVPAMMPDNPLTRRDFADFAVSAERLDGHYGRIFESLESNGLAERTIVIITTDHGIPFPRMKCNLTDHGLGVLLMMRGPEELGLRGGRVVDSMVSHTDILPSLIDWLNLEAEASDTGLQGKSHRPLMDGSLDPTVADALHEAVYAEISYHAQREVERAMRTPRYKYILNCDEPFARHSADPSISVDFLLEAGWGRRDLPQPAEQLYDLYLDPHEMNNLSSNPQHHHVVTDLRERLESRMALTNDPALTGTVPFPDA